MKYTEQYRCNLCSTIWYHEWDTEDYSNDCTVCPECGEFEFETLNVWERNDAMED